MKNITLTLFAATAIGAISVGSASAMPISNLSAELGERQVQNVRVVCNQYGRCYNTNRTYRRARSVYAPRYYNGPSYYNGPTYYNEPRYGYYGGPSIGIGPFGFRTW